MECEVMQQSAFSVESHKKWSNEPRLTLFLWLWNRLIKPVSRSILVLIFIIIIYNFTYLPFELNLKLEFKLLFDSNIKFHARPVQMFNTGHITLIYCKVSCKCKLISDLFTFCMWFVVALIIVDLCDSFWLHSTRRNQW